MAHHCRSLKKENTFYSLQNNNKKTPIIHYIVKFERNRKREIVSDRNPLLSIILFSVWTCNIHVMEQKMKNFLFSVHHLRSSD